MTYQPENEPLPFDLTGWQPIANAVREHIKQMHGRELTEIPEAA